MSTTARPATAVPPGPGDELAASGGGRAPRTRRDSPWTPWLFLAPYLALFLGFVVAPAVYGFWISLHDYDYSGYNEALLQTLLTRLLSGRDLVTTGKVLGASGARRQMQIYATDPALQRALGGSGMDGAFSVAGHDYLAVHTLNTNRSRMDYFQRRSIHHLKARKRGRDKEPEALPDRALLQRRRRLSQRHDRRDMAV